MITAKWSIGAGGFVKADANKCAQEIVSIGDSAEAQQIVDFARDENTELHKCFEWDDKVAGEAYRRDQARWVVRHLVIKEQEPPKDKPEIRFFFKPNKAEGYKQTQLIVRNEDEYASLLAQALKELGWFRAKYGRLVELEELFAVIDDMLA